MGRIITGLKAQKKNQKRVNVYLDGEFAFGLSRFVAAWLSVGQELSQEKIQSLQAEDAGEVAYQQALNLLGYRERSRFEIQQHLARHSVPEATIGAVVDRLQDNGLIDDQRFAQLWAENRAEFHPRSRSVIAMELKQKGVSAKDIEQALHEIDDTEMAYQAARKHAGKLTHLAWSEFRRKLFGHLSRRGFNYETAAQVAERIWAERESLPEDRILSYEEVDT